MSNILAKLKGDAAINVSLFIINNWDALKNDLINTLDDETIELTELKPNN